MAAKILGSRDRPPFDIFGYHPERKQERSLVARYFETIDTLLSGLSPDNQNFATQIASLPDGIRGYGHVKQASIHEVDSKGSVILERYKKGDADYREATGVYSADIAVKQLPG